MALSAQNEPVFCSLLFDLVRPRAKLTPDQYIKTKAMPERLCKLGIISEVERAQLIHADDRLISETKAILGDYWV